MNARTLSGLLNETPLRKLLARRALRYLQKRCSSRFTTTGDTVTLSSLTRGTAIPPGGFKISLIKHAKGACRAVHRSARYCRGGALYARGLVSNACGMGLPLVRSGSTKCNAEPNFEGKVFLLQKVPTILTAKYLQKSLAASAGCRRINLQYYGGNLSRSTSVAVKNGPKCIWWDRMDGTSGRLRRAFGPEPVSQRQTCP
jgi:hypothetical protein